MGCQKNITEKIRSLEGNYILVVKNNQEDLSEQCKKLFCLTAVSLVYEQTIL